MRGVRSELHFCHKGHSLVVEWELIFFYWLFLDEFPNHRFTEISHPSWGYPLDLHLSLQNGQTSQSLEVIQLAKTTWWWLSYSSGWWKCEFEHLNLEGKKRHPIPEWDWVIIQIWARSHGHSLLRRNYSSRTPELSELT